METDIGSWGLGAPAVAFSFPKSRWVLAWVDAAEDRYKIATMISSDIAGAEWGHAGIVYDDTFGQHHGSPGLACSDESGRCLVLYRPYNRDDTSQIQQRAVQIMPELTDLASLDTFAPLGEVTFTDLALARVRDGYVLAHVGDSTQSAPIRLRLKQGDEVAPWTSPSTAVPSIRSQLGVALAYNWRTDDVRVFWGTDVRE